MSSSHPIGEICHPPVSVDTKKQGELFLFVVCYSSETIRFLTHLSIGNYPSWFQFELATFANASRVLVSELNNWEQLLIWRLQNIPHISSHLANSHVDSVPCIDHRWVNFAISFCSFTWLGKFHSWLIKSPVG